MPNECVNRITVTCNESRDKILKEILIVPGVTITQRGKRGFRFECVTAWVPYNEWVETITRSYSDCWAKNKWISEDGKAGVWVGTAEKHDVFEWDDLSIDDECHLFA